MERIELEAAINQLTTNTIAQTKSKMIPLSLALNYHLSEDFYAPINVPTFNRSAMDGYAVKSSLTVEATKEKPIKLKVLKEIVAGADEGSPINNSHAVRIMTGAKIPDGFDAVIRQEDTNYGENEVEIYTQVKPYTNYGKMGEDVQAGQLMIKKSTRLTPIHLGIIASLGVNKIEVLQPLKIGLISTGSELVEVGQHLKLGQIYDSNAFVLVARLQELGVEVVFTKQHGDDIQEISQSIKERAPEVDMFITTGGVSVGTKDVMHDVIKELDVKRLFWRIQMRPGTPVLASLYQNKPILSLSGNPFAALTTFELLFRPMLSTFMQTKIYTCKREKAILMDDFNKESKQRRFVRAHYKRGQVYLSTSEHNSSVLSSMIHCNCLIDIKADSLKLKKGDEVEVVLLV